MLIRVAIVEDDEGIRASLVNMLSRSADCRPVCTCADAETALVDLPAHKPDVVLMDIDMPGVDTFGLVERLSIEAPDTRVVMLSGHAHRSFIERALDCGAWGYLSKNDDAATLMEGIRRVGRGEIALSEEVRTIHRNASP